MGIERITDHFEQAKVEFPGQFDDSAALQQLLEVILGEVQRAEDLSADCVDYRMLDDAVGVQLDAYGARLKLQRLDSENDGDYRALLRVTIRANNSEGGAGDVIFVATESMGGPVRYHREGTAYYRLQLGTDDGISVIHARRVLELLRRAAPSGVAWDLVTAPATDGKQFGLSRFNISRFGSVIGGDHE